MGASNVSQRLSGRSRAFLANSSGMIDLGALRGGRSSVARDLNDFGSVVGGSDSRNTVHAVLWKLN